MIGTMGCISPRLQQIRPPRMRLSAAHLRHHMRWMRCSRTMPCCRRTIRFAATKRGTKGTVMSQIQTEIDGAVLRIAINRPEKKNALTGEMYNELSDAFEQGDANPAIRVLLLHGN